MTPEMNEHFIPICKGELVQRLTGTEGLTSLDRQQFLDFCDALEFRLHLEFHSRLEQLKRSYSPFDPDIELENPTEDASVEIGTQADNMVLQVTRLLEQANFRRLAREEIEKRHDERLKAFGIKQAVIDDIDKDVMRAVDTATEACKAAPMPPDSRIWTSASPSTSAPARPTMSQDSTKGTRFRATLAAPPGYTASRSTFTTGTGASGEMRDTRPQMKRSSMMSPRQSIVAREKSIAALWFP